MTAKPPTWDPRLLDDDEFEVKWVPIGEIRIDTSYQRDLRQHWVAKITGGFRLDLVGIITCNQRTDGSIYVIDGQHRLAVLRGLGKQVVLCKVMKGLSREQEALVFWKLNTAILGTQAWDEFRARLAGGEPIAVEVDRIVQERGFRLSPDSKVANGLSAISAVERVHRWGQARLLGQVLDIVGAVWRSDPQARTANALQGIALFWERWSDDDRFDRDRFLTVLSDLSISVIFQDQRRLALLTGQQLTPGLFAVALRDRYNGFGRKGLKLTKKLEGMPRSLERGSKVGPGKIVGYTKNPFAKSAATPNGADL